MISSTISTSLTRQDDSHPVDPANNRPKHCGPGGTRGKGGHIIRNQITSLREKGMLSGFGMWGSSGDITTWTTELSSGPSTQGGGD